MFCSQCGTKLNDTARFCSNCGAACGTAAPVSEKKEKTTAAAVAAALPEGMMRDQDGNFRWTYVKGKETVAYYMNDEKVAKLLEVKEIKPDSTAKKVALGILDFVDAFGGGDSPYAELPSEMLGGPSETMYTPSERPWSYRYMIWIKGDRAHSRIRLYAEGSPEWLYVNPAQYDFVYHYITSHCPNVKIK